jgi:hypothetical protein
MLIFAPHKRVLWPVLLVPLVLSCEESETKPTAVDAPPADAAAGDTGAPRGPDASASADADIDAGGQDASSAPLFLDRVAGGTRLKPILAKVGDESYFAFAFWDTVLKTRCNEALAEDGMARCLPNQPVSPSPYFNDVGCTEPLFPAAEGCAEGFGFRSTPTGTAVFRLGAPATPVKVFALQASATRSTCVEVPVPAGQQFHVLGASIAPEEFVAVTGKVRQVQPEKRINHVVHEFADGAKDRTGWWDTKFNQACFTLRPASDDKWRCLPQRWLLRPEPTTFADVDCTKPLRVFAGSDAPEPFFAGVEQTTACPPRQAYFKTELQRDIKTVYSKTSAGCVAMAANPTRRYYLDLNEEVPPSEFAELTESIRGTGRLKRRVLTTSDGTEDVSNSPHDAQTGDLCRFRTSTDGVTRCLPFVETASYFADAACMTAASFPSRSLTCAAGARHVTRIVGPWCAQKSEVRALGPAVTQTHRLNAGVCEATSTAGTFQLGAPIDPATFVAAELVMP